MLANTETVVGSIGSIKFRARNDVEAFLPDYEKSTPTANLLILARA